MAEQAVDLANLRTLEEIRKAFETLKCNEDQTDKELETLEELETSPSGPVCSLWEYILSSGAGR